MMDLFKVVLWFLLGACGLLVMGYLMYMCECTSKEDKIPKWLGRSLQLAIMVCVVWSFISLGLWLDSVLHFGR